MEARPAGDDAVLTATAPFDELSARRLGPVRRYFVRHRVAMDVVVMSVYVLTALLGLLADARVDPYTRESRAGFLAVMAATTAVLFWRRRAPVPVTAGTVVLFGAAVWLTGTTVGVEIAVAFGVYAVAAARPTWLAWTVLGGAVAAQAGVVWLETLTAPFAERDSVVSGDGRLPNIVGIVVTGMLALAIGISVRNRRLHVADLVERTNALARDRDQQAQLARAAERSRIAREMHDVVAHSLSVMIALADGAGVALERAPERAREALDELSGTGRTALADMRRVLGVLDEDAAEAAPLDPQPGSPDLTELVERFRTAGLPVRAVLDGPLPDDANLQLAVYRIAQEALTNTLRHAPGTAGVTVRVAAHGGVVEVEVADEGATLAVPPSPGSGRGLVGMRERVGLYGGTVDAGPWRGGWRVRATIPWHEEAR